MKLAAILVEYINYRLGDSTYNHSLLGSFVHAVYIISDLKLLQVHKIVVKLNLKESETLQEHNIIEY